MHLKTKLASVLNTKKHIKIHIDRLDWQLENMERKVISEARVVATTLCNIYMSLDWHKRRFDVVILDEVPMASLPSVYVAVSHADSSVVLIGDPQQSAPISHAETPAAKNWLATDLFTFRQITLEEAAKGSNNSILLGQQAPIQTSILPIVPQDISHRPVTHGQMDKSSLRRFIPGLRSSNAIWLVNALVVWWSQQQAIRDLVGKDEQDPNTIVSDNPSSVPHHQDEAEQAQGIGKQENMPDIGTDETVYDAHKFTEKSSDHPS